MLKPAILAFALAGLAATASVAQTTPPPAASTAPQASPASPSTTVTAPAPAASPAAVNYRRVCSKEIKAVCGPSPKGEKQARAARRECVAANKAKFSADCQAAITAREADRLARKQSAPEKPKL